MTCLSFWWNRFQKLLPPQQPQLPQLSRRFHHRKLAIKRTLTKRRQRWPSAMAKIPYTCHVAHATKCNVEFVCRCFISNRMIPYIQRRKAMTLSSKQFAKIIVVEGYRSWIGEKHSPNIQSQKIQQYTQLIQKKNVSSWIKTWDTWDKLSEKVFFKVSIVSSWTKYLEI